MLKKKSFNIITFITAVMLVAAFTACGGGDEGTDTGDGTAVNPFKVYNVATLKKVGTETAAGGWTLSAYYEQTANIDMTGETWTPIGTWANRFSGSYDGGGKTITGLTINASSEDSQGLFGYTAAGVVLKNIGLAACNINGRGNVGGIAGENNGIVQDCYTTGDITGSFNCVGGVVGYNNTNGIVKNCYATGNVAHDQFVGGVVGLNSGTVQYCYATGDVSGGRHIGGVVGSSDGQYGYGIVKNCYATGNVNGTNDEVGGVVGSNYHGGSVQNCYATGNISGYNETGGVVGNNGGSVQNCYATGDISGFQRQGGAAGVDNGGTIENCIALNKSVTSGAISAGRIVGQSNIYSTLNNNYGRNNMIISSPSPHDGNDGADVTPANAILQTWWTTMASWHASSPWNWTNTWNYPDGLGKLPTLKGMPGNPTQNPVIKN